MCSLNRNPGAARATRLASVVLRTVSGWVAQIIALKLDQVEGVEENVTITIPTHKKQR
jgi:hypothetical protein